MADAPQADHTRRSGYRADIDGLRAVAVLAVVVYHLFDELRFFGYIGVDIFFVISGYLITGVIYQRVSENRFSLTDFYLSRIKRIIPAVYTVVVATFIAGLLLMLPEDINNLSKSVFATVFSASNIYFWYSNDTDYFAQASELVPLLHTWSLGVEEQFYFIWPLLLLVFARWLKLTGLLLFSLLVILLSFAYAEHMIGVNHAFAYYMLPTRAGELMLGALVCLWEARRDGARSLPTWLVEALAIAGFGLMLLGLFVIDSSNRFPGINAFWPCLGTALVIYSGGLRQTCIARLLALGPMVFIGLISYSLYLWHWPVLAFTRYLYVDIDGFKALLATLAFTALAYGSYRWIERPLRLRKISFAQAFTVYFALPSIVLASASFYVYRQDGLADWIAVNTAGFAEASARSERELQPAYDYPGVCQSSGYVEDNFDSSKCVVSSGASRALLWGDSNAAHFAGFLGALAGQQDVELRNVQVGFCPPVFRPDIDYGIYEHRDACRNFRLHAQRVVAEYDTVILAGVWESYAEHPSFMADLEATVSRITDQQVRVILMAQVPIFSNFDRHCALRNFRALEVDCEQRVQYQRQALTPAQQQIRAIAQRNERVDFYDLAEEICPAGLCSPYARGRELYFDPWHLNIPGSRYLGEQLLNSGKPVLRLD